MSTQPGQWRIAFDLWRAQRAGEAGLARRRDQRLAALLAHARTRSPLYRRLYHGVPEERVELRDLTPVNKRRLMDAFDEWVTDPRITRAEMDAFIADPERIGTLYRDALFVCTSSGTTGYPGLFLHDRHALAVYRAIVAVRIDLAWLGLRDWLRFARRGVRWAAILGTGGHFAGAGWVELERHRSARKARTYRVFSVQRPLQELVAELAAFDPTIIAAYPSALQLIADEQAAGRLHLRPILIEIAGESFTPEVQARMASALDCAVHNTYGASEFPFAAMSCAHGWLHVCSDWVILEPVDEDFRPTPAGVPSHTVLLTNLANWIQPIIRYDLGDSVVARADPCPCGSALPAIRVAGRSDDILHLESADGTSVAVLPLAISTVVEETPGVHRGQVLQTGPTALRLRLTAEPAADAERMWRHALDELHAYLTRLGVADVEIVRADEPPEQSPGGGKFRAVIATPNPHPAP